ncbi:hypothetical protein F5Y15DRAFT_417124 [Xylariaceae sp. FL0016]|nr:hypothetical protein F5Y15DRAFT_417124 [Xylariaceae sp. FL0016]
MSSTHLSPSYLDSVDFSGHVSCDGDDTSFSIKSEPSLDSRPTRADAKFVASALDPRKAKKRQAALEKTQNDRYRQYSNTDWDAQKSKIRKLYLDDEKSLEEVMAAMEAQEFRATKRMYKARLAKWGFTKNNRKSDIVLMLRVQRQRSALGKRTVFYRNGKPVDIDDYLARKGLSAYDLAEPGIVDTQQLPPHVRAVTPPPAGPRSLQSPGVLHVQEVLFKAMAGLSWKAEANAYAQAVYSNGRAPPVPSTVPSSSRRGGNGGVGGGGGGVARGLSAYRRTAPWWALCTLRVAGSLFADASPHLAGAMCEASFRALHKVALTPSPFAICDLLAVQVASLGHGIATEVWRYLAACTAGAPGPLPQFFAGVSRLLQELEYDACQTLFRSCLQRILATDGTHLSALVKQLPQGRDGGGAALTAPVARDGSADTDTIEVIKFMQRFKLFLTGAEQPRAHGHWLTRAHDLLRSNRAMQASLHRTEVHSLPPNYERHWGAFTTFFSVAVFHKTQYDQQCLPSTQASHQDATGKSPHHAHSTLGSKPESPGLSSAIYYMQRAHDTISVLAPTDAPSIVSEFECLRRLDHWNRTAGNLETAAAARAQIDQCVGRMLAMQV